MDEMRTHAVREFHENRDPADGHAEEIRNVGYSVLPSGLTADALAQLRRKIDDVYDRQVGELGGEEALRRINDANLARCLVEYDHDFLDLAIAPALLA